MSQLTLEDRVTALEKTVARMLAQSPKVEPVSIDATPEDAWESTIGVFADDPLFDRFVEEGRRIRQADRTNDDE